MGTKNRCLIIGPLSELDPSKMKFENIYKQLILPIFDEIREKYEINWEYCTVDTSGFILGEILERIRDYDILIADVTHSNPNVLWELGVRHAIKQSGTILIRQFCDEEFPYDLRTLNIFQFSPELGNSINDFFIGNIKKSIPSKIKLGGFIESLVVRADCSLFSDYLITSQVVHVGQGATFGLGKLKLYFEKEKAIGSGG